MICKRVTDLYKYRINRDSMYNGITLLLQSKDWSSILHYSTFGDEADIGWLHLPVEQVFNRRGAFNSLYHHYYRTFSLIGQAPVLHAGFMGVQVS